MAVVEEPRQRMIAYFLLLVTALIWGGTWPLGRWLVSEDVGGETIPPMMIAAIRYCIVVPLFLLLLYWREGSINWKFMKEHWKVLCFLGVTSVTIYQGGYLIGEYFTAASDASVIVSCQPMLVLIFASMILKMEELNKTKISGTLISFSGVLLIFGYSPNTNVPNRILGDFLIFLAAVSYSIYIVSSRHFLNRFGNHEDGYQPSSLYIITWTSVFGLVTTFPVALLINPEYIFNPILYFQIPERIWLGIAYLAFLSTIIGYWFYLEGIKRLTASRAVIFQNLVPILGVLLSVILLGEIFDPIIHSSSIILIISGITIVNKSKN